jgi:hypothetical protein
MKKGILAILALVSVAFFFGSTCLAATPYTTPISVGATLPEGTLGYDIHEITDPTGAVWGPVVSGFDFGTLKELIDPATGLGLGVFSSDRGQYFVVDLAYSGGGAPSSLSNVQISLSDPASPLATRMTGTYFKAVFTSATTPPDENALFSTALTFAAPTNIASSTFSGGWARFYVGIVTNPTAVGMPADADVFTAATTAGSYSASVIITAL